MNTPDGGCKKRHSKVNQSRIYCNCNTYIYSFTSALWKATHTYSDTFWLIQTCLNNNNNAVFCCRGANTETVAAKNKFRNWQGRLKTAGYDGTWEKNSCSGSQSWRIPIYISKINQQLVHDWAYREERGGQDYTNCKRGWYPLFIEEPLPTVTVCISKSAVIFSWRLAVMSISAKHSARERSFRCNLYHR